MWAKFCVLEQTQGIHLQAKFHLNEFIVSASGGQKPQFLTILTFLGAPVPTPFYRWGRILCATLTSQISPECVHCIGFRWPKTTILDKFLPFRGFCNGQIWCATADPMCTLTGQISSECVHCVGFRWPKPQFWSNFDIFVCSCTDPVLPMRAKFGVLEQTQRLNSQARLHLNVFIVSASVFQKPQFWANFDILGAPVPTPFYRLGPNLACYSRHTVYLYLWNFVSIGLCRPVAAKNPNFCRFLDFGI